MARYRVVLILVLLLMVAESAFAQPTWKRRSVFRFDWDGHKDVQVVLEIPSTWSDPGDFTRIRIRVPGQNEFRLTNKHSWVKYGSDEASTSPEISKMKNLVGSKHVLALEATDKRTLLFLFGYSYASSPGSLDVLELSRTGQPRVVLHQEEFGLKDVRDLDGDGIAEIIGYPCLSQEFGNGLQTYDPFNVYELGEKPATPAQLSLALSKSYNLKHYYGWAGAQCREDVAVVLHPPGGGKPRVMSMKEAEKLTGSKP
jgi:hypothetical protein